MLNQSHCKMYFIGLKHEFVVVLVLKYKTFSTCFTFYKEIVVVETIIRSLKSEGFGLNCQLYSAK